MDSVRKEFVYVLVLGAVQVVNEVFLQFIMYLVSLIHSFLFVANNEFDVELPPDQAGVILTDERGLKFRITIDEVISFFFFLSLNFVFGDVD